jgi:serine protease Do
MRFTNWSGRLGMFGAAVVGAAALALGAVGGAAGAGGAGSGADGVQNGKSASAPPSAPPAAPPSAPPAPATGAGSADPSRDLLAKARDKVFPALVNIRVVTVDYWSGKERKGEAVGSGTIIDATALVAEAKPGLYVLTNQHVTDNGKKFRCTLADKREVRADLVGEDPLTDLAILRINLEDLKKVSDSGQAPPPVAELGDSAKVEVGDSVLAMGSPFALSRTVTLGIVSNTERILGTGRGDDDLELENGQRTGIFTRWIQHDALINPGNSGGPLVNMAGEVIGVNTRGGAGNGFASPSNLAKVVASALIRNGEMSRSSIGIGVRRVQDTPFNHGVLITSVNEDSPAGRAGLKAGDLLTKVDGQTVTVRFPEEVPDFMRLVAEKPVGATVTFDYERDGKPGEAKVVTEKMLKDKGDERVLKQWGITVAEITEKMARDRRLDSTDGVLVSGIRSGGPAATAEPSLGWGDVIRSIGDRPIKTLKEMVAAYDAIMLDGSGKELDNDKLPEWTRIGFWRDGRSGGDHITLVKTREDKPQDPPREVAKGWIGVATQPVLQKLAENLSIGEAGEVQGFRVTRIYGNTKAAASGLKVGDIIVSLDGERVRPRTTQDAGLFQRQVRKREPEGSAKIVVLRVNAQGKAEKVELEMPLERTRIGPEEALRERDTDFEMVVRELTFFDRDDNRWPETVQGVLLDQLEPAGWAGLGGLRGGDLVQQIDERTVTDLASFREAIADVKKRQPERVQFVVYRGNNTAFVFVEPDWRPQAGVTDKQPTAQGAGAAPGGTNTSTKPK